MERESRSESKKVSLQTSLSPHQVTRAQHEKERRQNQALAHAWLVRVHLPGPRALDGPLSSGFARGIDLGSPVSRGWIEGTTVPLHGAGSTS